MNANRFISISMDLWNNRKFLELRIRREGEPAMLTTGLFVRLICLCYDYDGVIDFSDPVTRKVVSSELELIEEEAAAFIEDCVAIKFFDAELWAEKRHAVSHGVTEQIKYQKNEKKRNSAAGKASGEARRKKAEQKKKQASS